MKTLSFRLETYETNLVDHIVGEILVQVGKTVGISRKSMVLSTKTITSSHFSEADQIDHVESRDVIGSIAQMRLPVTYLPEPETVHLLTIITEGSVAVGCSLQIEVDQLL